MPKLIPYNPQLKQLAKELRNKSTLAEVLLWKKLKGKALGVEFHRQVPLNEYIVDFYCHELQFAIEIDSNNHDNKFEYDVSRQTILETLGIKFLRFNDIDVKKDINNVLRAIKITIEEISNIPLPPSKGE